MVLQIGRLLLLTGGDLDCGSIPVGSSGEFIDNVDRSIPGEITTLS